MNELNILFRILTETRESGILSVSKQTPRQEIDAINVGLDLGLINERSYNNYKISIAGLDCLQIGSVLEWRQINEERYKPQQNINISGSVTNSQIGQGSSFGDPKTGENT